MSLRQYVYNFLCLFLILMAVWSFEDKKYSLTIGFGLLSIIAAIQNGTDTIVSCIEKKNPEK